MTPMGPDRLTLPPDHQQPTFAPITRAMDQHTTLHRDRPGSSRFAQYASRTSIDTAVPTWLCLLMDSFRQYAYNPAEASQQGVVHVSLSHQQAAPRHALARQTQGHTATGNAHIATQSRLPYDYLSAEAFNEAGPSSGMRPTDLRGAGTARTQMPPPPAPQIPRTAASLQQRTSFRPPATPQLQPSGGSHRFVPLTPTRPTGTSNRALLQQAPDQQGPQTQRFSGLPGAQPFTGLGARSSTAGQQQNEGRVSRNPSFAASGGQRTPFLPNR